MKNEFYIYVVVTGELLGKQALYGPFSTHTEAVEWVERELESSSTWNVVPVLSAK